MKPVTLGENIYWIGALHPELRVFDIIMNTPHGTTYNSYLIKDEKNVVIDTVKHIFTDEYILNLSELIDLKDLDYIIVQHNEPDHSGSMLKLLEAAPNAQVICAGPAAKYVTNIVNKEINIRKVKQGDTLELGKRTLEFIPAPFLHWPDTMITWLPDDGILFPCDIFAAHYSDPAIFDDQIDHDLGPDAKYYYDCIMRPFGKFVRNMLDKIEPLDVKIIAPSHGPVLRKNAAEIIQSYKEWSAVKPANDPKQVLIYYATAHGNTKLMAEAIAKGALDAGCRVSVFDTMEINTAGHLDQIEAADAILLGSPTINNNVVKPVWDVLNNLVTVDVKGKIAGSFGSLGWSGEAVPQLDERLKAMKFKVPFEGITTVLVPSQEDLDNCVEFGKNIASQLN